MVDPSVKIPLNVSSLVGMVFPLLAVYFVTALLVIFPGTVVWRRSLLPFTLWLGLRVGACLDVSGGDPIKAQANQSHALFTFMIVMRCIVWAVYSDQVRPIPGTPADANVKRASVRAALQNACDLALGFRELSWQGPSKPRTLLQVPPSQQRFPFLRGRILSVILHLILGDALLFALQSFSPELSTPGGGSVFDPSLPASWRYLRSTTMTFLFGTLIYVTTRTVYDAISVLAILILRQSPSQWPPLFFSPWRATSLTELWGDRWHHLNRSYMVALGAKPVSRIFGRAAGVLGAFTISGLMHDLGLRAVGRGSDFVAIFGFFFMMGVGVVMESAWKSMSGRLPSGIGGRLWILGWLGLWGNRAADAWLTRGAAASGLVPGPYRPFKLVWAFVTEP
ncbi:membrane bound O-acyl transferase family-domain-containing protein [Pisolithus tinctorius]|uniref:Wax synthase domain-containing protein n=1 Tax=Pisolithus tinctorius Marx 270 TaxID=870435 RepID=A0A0C3K0N0_PISTI|nr:membrane bound O-acyl transferase family-domain-containing protein [Pisolithus tinctorius]KIO14948.1 hypothetical protein M404DRAFT_991683 [Pisolithus tinctorius Marx 270]